MSYAAAYLGTKPIVNMNAGSGGLDPWIRPADWPALPVLGPAENKFVGVYGVENTDGNFVSLVTSVSSGTWTVDWGDGIIETGLTSGVQQNHVYDYASISATPTAVGGWKPVVVTVTTSGGNITTFSLRQKHPTLTASGAYRVNWLDVSINAPSMTALSIGGNLLVFSLLEQATIGVHSMTSLSEFFRECSALQSVPLFNTASVTSMYAMFFGCTSLQSVPLFNTASVTNMDFMLERCRRLRAVPLFNTAAATTMAGMFRTCTSLESVPLFNTASVLKMNGMFQSCGTLQLLPFFNTASCNDMSTMFSNCYSLKSVPLFSTAAVTTMNTMFLGCTALETVPLLNTGAVTNMAEMFRDCYSLKTVPLFNTAAVTNMQSIFQGCGSIQSFPLFNTASVTNMLSMMNGCISLKSVPLFNTAAVTNMQAMLSGTAVRTAPLFNTAAVTNFSQMFLGCVSLESVPEYNTAAATVAATNMFLNCRGLARGRTNGLRFSTTYSGCKLSATQINAIFTGLGTASGAQTITVSNNYGYATCTPTIATLKGWIVN